MSTRQLSPVGTPTTPTMSFTPVRSGLLQRKCACGGTTGLSGECEDCRKKGVGKLQRHTATQPSTFNPQPSEMPPIVHEVLRSPGQPLDPATRAFMEPRFGHDFSHVRVHTDVNAAASARAVSALAYTVGRDVVFSSGQYSPATRRGKELLAHELTHVAQQRGIAGAPTDIAPEKSVHENEAGEVSRQLFSSPQPIPKLTPARSAVQRYQIEGPWNWNDPVHETITEEALRRAGLLKLGEDFNDPVVWEYIRGVLWNDDPEGQLFDSRKTKTNNYSSGAAWTDKFKGSEKKAAEGIRFGPTDDLLPRSHFGDLQFIHGMASEDNEKAAVTQGNIMKWAEFTYKVAIGEISGNTTMAKIGVSGIAELFPRLKGQTVSSFFGIHNIGDVKQRAAGSLVHMIQDSYASGHAQREQGADGKKGKVISFHSYSGQDHDKHGHDDAFQGKGSDQNKLKRTPGALDAVEQSAQMFKFIHERRSWEDVKLYLEMEVFGLIPGALPAGTGNPYLKKGRTREPEYVRPGIPKDTGDYELRKRRLVEG